MTSALIEEFHDSVQFIATHNITRKWTKERSNSMGNNDVDELAKRGTKPTACGPKPLLPVPQTEIKTLLRANTEGKHKIKWINHKGCNPT